MYFRYSSLAHSAICTATVARRYLGSRILYGWRWEPGLRGNRYLPTSIIWVNRRQPISIFSFILVTNSRYTNFSIEVFDCYMIKSWETVSIIYWTIRTGHSGTMCLLIRLKNIKVPFLIFNNNKLRILSTLFI